MTPSSGSMHRNRRIARALLSGLGILGLGILLTAAVLEAWGRLQPRRFFLVFDETLGFRLEPGATGEYRGRWMLAANPHIRTPIRINELGMRGPERARSKPPGTRRLIVLGDSFVQAFEVPWEETFYALLEDRVRRAGGRRLESLPMGVNGYGQAQQLLWLEREGVGLAPDLVLLVAFLGNDITDNSRGLGSGTARPYFGLRDGRLVQVAAPSRAARWKYLAAQHLRTFLLYREIAVHVDALLRLARATGWVNYPEARTGDAPDLARRQRDAWDLTAALIDEMSRVAATAGARFLVAFHGSYPTGSPEAPRERMLRLCSDIRVECLDLSAGLDGRDAYFVPDDDHWTAAGHGRVADLLWDRWRAALVADGSAAAPTTGGIAGADAAASRAGAGPQISDAVRRDP